MSDDEFSCPKSRSGRTMTHDPFDSGSFTSFNGLKCVDSPSRPSRGLVRQESGPEPRDPTSLIIIIEN